MSNPPCHTATALKRPAPTNRGGTVLVECLVSLVLLAGAAALLQLIASSSATTLDRALQVDATLGTVDLVHQRWIRATCANGSPGHWMPTLPVRLDMTVVPEANGALHGLSTRSMWTVSALAVGDTRQHERILTAAFRCDP
ncbi:MAG TPA: hypothetical protein VGE27_16165 [Gemmatimonas sp.]|uniref:hypothetical protein n=1 Tax=Gemmatimonas sp. TaxID=1962908 RepID=UPI002ED8C486